jgi:hypothetical protein
MTDWSGLTAARWRASRRNRRYKGILRRIGHCADAATAQPIVVCRTMIGWIILFPASCF